METIMGSTGTSVQSPTDAATIASQHDDWEARTREYDRQWEDYRRRRSAVFPITKAAIFDALQVAGITRVVIEFEGSGDSGQMEQATAFQGEEEIVAFPKDPIQLTNVEFGDGKDTEAEVSLRDAIETVAYELLGQTHGSWEDGDGGSGTFTFDVAEQSITLDFDERYIDTNNYVHTF
jgi:hypothetical protein